MGGADPEVCRGEVVLGGERAPWEGAEEGATQECRGSSQLGLGAGGDAEPPLRPSTNTVTSDTQKESRGRPELPDLLP